MGLMCPAQDTSSVSDTLTAANKVAYRGIEILTGRTLSDIETVRNIITPIGEGDAIKLIQALPGIATGAEGSSAIYARGGNIGNNLMSLDGVTIYGISHLLGMTSSVSSDVIGETNFQIGGFDADRGAALSSFIGLKSAASQMDKWHISGIASPFLESVKVEGPVSDRTGVLVTGRFSPIGLAYKSAKDVLASDKGLKSLDATVYDVYGKVQSKDKKGNELTAFIFRSADEYDIVFGKNADRYKMGWNNTIGLIKYSRHHSIKTRSEYDVSYNVYESGQSSNVLFNSTINQLKIKSSIKEFVASAKLIYKGNRNSFQAGGQIRNTKFNPGSSSLSSEWADQKRYSLSAVLWGQYEYRKSKELYLKAATRINSYRSGETLGKSEKTRYIPEMSILGEYSIIPNVKLMATIDRVAQFHHILEGMPLGWSMDLIVPSDDTIPYESAYQGYLGMTGLFMRHKITVGGYYKTMENLVYYTNAANIFSASFAGWKDNVEVGNGSSYGIETLYEYSGKRLSARVAYTLSKTDRTFENLNKGNPFPAKFDRRHILNTSVEYDLGRTEITKQGISSAFTLQSGHWESYRLYSYESITPDDDKYLIPYFDESPNNLQMPAYIRLDIGYFRNWRSASQKINYKLQVGVYNILNRHNPLLLMYDDDADQWMELSLIPIMPTVSFRIEF